MSKPCGCGIPTVPKFPKAGLEIFQQEPPVQFHKKVFPASLGDETAYPPNTLDYKNIILEYQASGNVYIYSSDGIPTKINGADAADFLKRLEALSTQISEETVNREEADKALQNQIDANSGAIAAQTESLAAITADLQSEVQLDTTVSGDASTVSITKKLGQIGKEGTETALPLPVASSETAGVMNPATYNAVQENSENIDSILGGAVWVNDLPANPTQDELTAQWKATTGKINLINRASIYDETNKLVWYYYENVAEWKSMPAGDAAVSVSIATNDATGIVKGSTENGQVAVEADGSMSLNGYDGMQHDIDNLSQLVAGIEIPKVPTIVVGHSVASSNPIEVEQNKNSAYPKGFVRIKYHNYNTVTGAEAASHNSAIIPPANLTYPGVMSVDDKSKLDSLLTIKALDDTLSLSEDGILSVVAGGGSDVNLLTDYTASPAEDDAYSAAYINSRLDRQTIKFGNNAQAAGTSIAIGYFSSAVGDTIAIGNFSKSSKDLSLGEGMIALGIEANVSHRGAIALGYQAKSSRRRELSIGNPNSAQYPTRYIANVTPGELPTDAVNLQQMQDYVSEHGNPFTEMETTRVQNLPPAVVTGFEDTTYGTDTITMHLDTKDLATGGVSVQELALEPATPNTADAGGHAGIMSAFQATQLQALAEAGVDGTVTTEQFNAAWEAA